MMLSDKAKGILDAVSAQLAKANSNTDGSRIRCGFRDRIHRFLDAVRSAMYPKIYGHCDCAEARLNEAAELLSDLIAEVMPARSDLEREDICLRFFSALPTVVEVLATDVRAAYEGDPAAKSEEEIMLAYPAFEAISIYRLAHELFKLGVPLIPRMMTEIAHASTGVDIHPGATIGRYFFIDHATGVVIGETCTIGDHVKLYQGVTLGAKSFETDENGNPVKGIKRHPDIGNHVIIYANATVLGGNTKVGDGCVIGASVWITRSVAPGEKVYYTGGQ